MWQLYKYTEIEMHHFEDGSNCNNNPTNYVQIVFNLALLMHFEMRLLINVNRYMNMLCANKENVNEGFRKIETQLQPRLFCVSNGPKYVIAKKHYHQCHSVWH